MPPTNVFVAALLCVISFSDAAYAPFKRNVGTLDAMDDFNPSYPGFRPIQQSPIYGIDCLDNSCYNQRFLTVRYQNLVIVKYVNHWTPLTAGNSGRWQISCPNNMLSLGMWCHENSCNKIRLVCGTIGTGFLMKGARTTVNPPSSPSDVSCPNGQYMQGIECFGYDCQRRGLKCVGLQYNRRVQGKFEIRRTDNRQVVGHWFSEEWGGLSQAVQGPMFALHCSGPHYCDNKIFHSVLRGTIPMLEKPQIWRGPLNDIGSVASCPSGMVVGQMRCSYDFCRELLIGCAKPANKKIMVVDDDRLSSNVFSQYWPFEDTASCPEGYYIREISCLRSYCSHMVLGCVKMTFVE